MGAGATPLLAARAPRVEPIDRAMLKRIPCSGFTDLLERFGFIRFSFCVKVKDL
jgi:hypothetical protein